METPKLIGNSELTDTDGYATFRGFQLQTGIPGSYVITAVDTVSGRTKKLGKVKTSSSIATAIILEDGRQKLKFGRRGLPPRIVSGESIPIIRVKILNSKREGIPNKVCVLTSASKEAAEFSNVGARPDVFHPRLVVINNQFSSISNFSGIVEFRNVTLATSIRHVRLWAVCDGRVANYEESSVKSIIFLASRKYSQTHTLLASIVQQPSTEVLEGEAFARQPSLLLQYKSISTGQLIPAEGEVVFAFPFMQAGFKSRNVMSPAAVAELEILRESEQAVLGNLGRVKQLQHLVSMPADANGIANFTNLGFIRHGESGDYSLGFASTGLFEGLESTPIAVRSSVAEVKWVISTIFDEYRYISMAANAQGFKCFDATSPSGYVISEICPDILSTFPNISELVLVGRDYPYLTSSNISATYASSPPARLASTICNSPSCQSSWGSSSGFLLYNTSVTAGKNFSEFRPSPSGTLNTPPTLIITDKDGRSLAGKQAKPIVGTGVEISEVPYKGASVSKLKSFSRKSYEFAIKIISTLAQSSPPVPYGSFLSYHKENLAPHVNVAREYGFSVYKSAYLTWVSTEQDYLDFQTESREIGDQGSFFRVVSSPRGITKTLFAFDVEGVKSQSTTIEVFNLDSETNSRNVDTNWAPPIDSICAHIRILQTPSFVRQDGSVRIDDVENTMSLLFLDENGLEKPFIVQAINSFGEPVQVNGIGMYAVDALGYVMLTSVGGEHVGLSLSYTNSLRGLGAATLTIGNYSSMSILREHMHAPISLQNSNETGHAVFNLTRIRRAQNTWVKFAFVALYADVVGFTTNKLKSFLDYYGTPLACVSEFSNPVSIDSVIASVDWDGNSSRFFSVSGIASDKSDVSALFSLPSVRVTSTMKYNSSLQSAGAFPIINVFGESDSIFETAPAHVALTARTFYRDLDTFSVWANVKGQVLPQLENALIPPSFSDNNQVASISSSVPSTLGLQLNRWASRIENEDVNSTGYEQIVTNPSSFLFDSSGTATAVGTFPRIASSKGNVRVYNFVAFCGGVSGSESIQVSYEDDINAVVIVDHSESLPGLCPLPSIIFGRAIPSRDELACQTGCSGHGHCVCGICVCADGYDGAEDCSKRYEGDDFGRFFSKSDDLHDEYYNGKYGGLPVYDIGKAMKSLENSLTTAYAFFRLKISVRLNLMCIMLQFRFFSLLLSIFLQVRTAFSMQRLPRFLRIYIDSSFVLMVK